MKTKKRKIILTILLLISLGNYGRLEGTEDIRTVDFISIFAVGALAALLVKEVFSKENAD